MARYSLLLVDDDTAVRSMLKTVLETHGYALTTAASAADAKAKLGGDGKFDLVLTDMRMETDTAGYEVVRAAAALPEVPAIVIMTAFPLLARQWRELGAHAVLSKPTRMTDLLDTIGRLIAERHAARR